MSDQRDKHVPTVIANTSAQPHPGDYRVPHAGNTWGQEDETQASGLVATIGCLGLALVMLAPLFFILLFLSDFMR